METKPSSAASAMPVLFMAAPFIWNFVERV